MYMAGNEPPSEDARPLNELDDVKKATALLEVRVAVQKILERSTGVDTHWR